MRPTKCSKTPKCRLILSIGMWLAWLFTAKLNLIPKSIYPYSVDWMALGWNHLNFQLSQTVQMMDALLLLRLASYFIGIKPAKKNNRNKNAVIRWSNQSCDLLFEKCCWNWTKKWYTIQLIRTHTHAIHELVDPLMFPWQSLLFFSLIFKSAILSQIIAFNWSAFQRYALVNLKRS